MYKGKLFRRGFTFPLLECLDEDQAMYLLVRLPQGIYIMHSEG